MLHQLYPPNKLESILLPQANWHPFPAGEAGDQWQALPAGVRQAHLHLAETYLQTQWPELQATRFLDYARDGNRSRYQDLCFQRRSMLAALVVGECIEGQGRFVDDIVNGVWAICEESYWGVPAHIRVQKAGNGLPDTAEPTVDLFAAETASLLAWIHYLLGPQLDAVSPLVRARIKRECEIRILTPNFERDDFWWMGFKDVRGRRVNNWNPWINSNWLVVALLLVEDQAKRIATVSKILQSLDYFIDPYPQDGGCDEGPSYWGRAGASLFDCLEILHSATSGGIDVYDDALIQNIGKFIYRVQIEGDYFINFADAPALVYPSAAIIFNYGRRIHDSAMMALGAWTAHRQDLFELGFAGGKGKRLEGLGRQLYAFFSLADMAATTPTQPLPRDVWLEDIEVMVARDQAGSSAGFFVAAKGGHNNESHNHNDIGNFVVYRDGKPIFVDAGVEDYTAKTFSPQRYEIWTMQSAYHSLLPTIDGVMQPPGTKFSAQNVTYQMDDVLAQLQLDIAAAYSAEANIQAWERIVKLERGQGITITDTFSLAKPVAEIMFCLITPCSVDLSQSDRIQLNAQPIDDERDTGMATLFYPTDGFHISTEIIPITDIRLRQAWYQNLNRLVFIIKNPPQQGSWIWRIA